MSCLVVVGDALLDREVDGSVSRVAPDAPIPVLEEQVASRRPGGAALAAALAAATGAEVQLVAAIGGDPAAAELEQLLAAANVELLALRGSGATPEKIRFRSGTHPLLRLDRGGAPLEVGPPSRHVLAAIEDADAVLVSDYGRGITSMSALRSALASRTGELVWDPHPRGAPPVPGCRLVTPNAREVPAPTTRTDLRAVAEAAEHARRTWRAGGVALTLGPGGACYVDGSGTPFLVPARATVSGDACGAGDRFAGAAALALGAGAIVSEAVMAAVRAATEFVALGGAAAFGSRATAVTAVGDGLAVAERVRDAGGCVVATGGCFDVLHAGHLSSLHAARRLGDCLIVCLNSDRSVRALKGLGRPVVCEEDRRAALLALDCVDAVVVFDEPTPAAVLEKLRPSIFAKGADYGGGQLPEQEVLDRWGGQCVTLPYVTGFSTTRLVQGVGR